MTLEARIHAMAQKYTDQAKALDLEGVACRRLLVRQALHATAQLYRAFAEELQGHLSEAVSLQKVPGPMDPGVLRTLEVGYALLDAVASENGKATVQVRR